MRGDAPKSPYLSRGNWENPTGGMMKYAALDSVALHPLFHAMFKRVRQARGMVGGATGMVGGDASASVAMEAEPSSSPGVRQPMLTSV